VVLRGPGRLFSSALLAFLPQPCFFGGKWPARP
jgi:hypothetical protein